MSAEESIAHSASIASQDTASNVAPWTMCAVDPKSGKRKNSAETQVLLFAFQALELGNSEYTPYGRSAMRQAVSANSM